METYRQFMVLFVFFTVYPLSLSSQPLLIRILQRNLFQPLDLAPWLSLEVELQDSLIKLRKIFFQPFSWLYEIFKVRSRERKEEREGWVLSPSHKVWASEIKQEAKRICTRKGKGEKIRWHLRGGHDNHLIILIYSVVILYVHWVSGNEIK